MVIRELNDRKRRKPKIRRNRVGEIIILNNMEKYLRCLLLVTAIAISCNMNAQGLKTFLEDVTMDLHFGLTGAGYYNTPFSTEDGGEGLGLHIGTRASKPFYDIDNKTYLYGGLGIDYTLKGGDCISHHKIGSNMMHANYLEIPIHAGINRRITRGISLFAEVGTYMAYGIGGKLEGPDGEDVRTFDEVLNPFDAGVLYRFGTNLGRSFRIEIGDNIGLIDTNRKTPMSKKMLLTNKAYMSSRYVTLSWKISGVRKNTGVRK